jgi:hypothetical protein
METMWSGHVLVIPAGTPDGTKVVWVCVGYTCWYPCWNQGGLGMCWLYLLVPLMEPRWSGYVLVIPAGTRVGTKVVWVCVGYTCWYPSWNQGGLGMCWLYLLVPLLEPRWSGSALELGWTVKTP